MKYYVGPEDHDIVFSKGRGRKSEGNKKLDALIDFNVLDYIQCKKSLKWSYLEDNIYDQLDGRCLISVRVDGVKKFVVVPKQDAVRLIQKRIERRMKTFQASDSSEITELMGICPGNDAEPEEQNCTDSNSVAINNDVVNLNVANSQNDSVEGVGHADMVRTESDLFDPDNCEDLEDGGFVK
jgi:hypothetical protein